MLNHITNRLKVVGTEEQVKEVLDSIKSVSDLGTEITIDFNKIIPQPDNIFNGNLGEKERQMCIR